MRKIPSLTLFLLAIIVIAIVSFFGPAERSLGTNVRLVYIHGAWVWTALIAFSAAAATRPYGMAPFKTFAAHLVKRFWASRYFFLDHLPSAQPVDDASKLEWAIPR